MKRKRPSSKPNNKRSIPNKRKPQLAENLRITQFFKKYEQTQSPPQRTQTWSQVITPDEKPRVQYTQNSISLSTEEEYLNVFLQLLRVAKSYGIHLMTQEEKDILNKFEELTKGSQITYVRLFTREKEWYNLESFRNQQVESPLEAGKELLSVGLARSFKTAFLCEDTQLTYDFLATLTKDMLIKLETHLRELIFLLTGNDHSECALPKFARKYKNPLYKVYFKFQTVSELSCRVSNLLFEELTPKETLIQVIIEQLTHINLQRENPQVCLRVRKLTQQVLNCQDPWLYLMTPDSLPPYIRICPQSQAFFIRMQRAFTFYAYSSPVQEILVLKHRQIKFPEFKCCFETPNFIYESRENLLEIEEAYNLKEVIRNLRDYNLDSEIYYEIALGVAKVALQRFSYKEEVPEVLIEKFIESYQVKKVNWKDEYTGMWVWAKLLYLSLEFIQRCKNYEFCLVILINLLSSHYYYNKRGHMWERLIIVLKAHLKLTNQAKVVTCYALKDPFLKTGKRLTIEKQAERLEIPLDPKYSLTEHKNYTHPLYQVITINVKRLQGDKPTYLNDNNEKLSVEEYAIWHYKKKGWKGYHSENSLLVSIFGVLMWEALFYDRVPYAFQSPFQSCALDFKSPQFFSLRQKVFLQNLEKLTTTEDLYNLFVTEYTKHYKTKSYYVNWEMCEKIGKHNLGCIVKNLGSSAVKSICQVLALDFKNHSSGMPDLILWTEIQAKFCEVKSHHDKLSDQQRMWISLLNSKGIRAELLQIKSF